MVVVEWTMTGLSSGSRRLEGRVTKYSAAGSGGEEGMLMFTLLPLSTLINSKKP